MYQAVERTLLWEFLLSTGEEPGRWSSALCRVASSQTASSLCPQAGGIGFDGYAVGGVSVGEPEPLLLQGIEESISHLPEERPRYVMGLGDLWQMTEAAARGADMFDCVMPTRHARNGSAFTRNGAYPVKAGKYKRDPRPIEEGCRCPVCRTFTRAYIRHLLNAKEILGVRLLRSQPPLLQNTSAHARGDRGRGLPGMAPGADRAVARKRTGESPGRVSEKRCTTI